VTGIAYSAPGKSKSEDDDDGFTERASRHRPIFPQIREAHDERDLGTPL
jgi:hypothetical protein